MPKTINNPKGFTLVELLVVITIIAILSVIGVVVYQGQVKNARDSARKTDIDAIANAMEANKVAGSVTYNAMADTFFASGKAPTDPTSTNVAPEDACPGVCKYCVRTGAGTCKTSDTTVGVGAPGAVSTWTVCANLEAGGQFCRSNSQ
ncbi:prepilin-type N-terminal cleavage/methylation domain-containing protein [Candidatus Daviesbacteria bacterium]|nr:prepilin-type N-terminal cleavage/methylation domain-containing protein [Candidatus Daviesbacteria bacterium]